MGSILVARHPHERESYSPAIASTAIAEGKSLRHNAEFLDNCCEQYKALVERDLGTIATILPKNALPGLSVASRKDESHAREGGWVCQAIAGSSR
jgi:hypothetical protein